MSDDRFENPVEVLPGILSDMNKGGTEAFCWSGLSGTQTSGPMDEYEHPPVDLNSLDLSVVCLRAEALRARILFYRYTAEHIYKYSSSKIEETSPFIAAMEDDVSLASEDLLEALDKLGIFLGVRLSGDIVDTAAISLLLSLIDDWDKERAIEYLDIAIAQLKNPVWHPGRRTVVAVTPVSTRTTRWISPISINVKQRKVLRKDIGETIPLPPLACKFLQFLSKAKGGVVTVPEMAKEDRAFRSKDYVHQVVQKKIRPHFDQAIVKSGRGQNGGFSLTSLAELRPSTDSNSVNTR